jgi:uncharacterized protein with PIN domain
VVTVVDTSALVAISRTHLMQHQPARLLSAVTRVELSFVIEGCKRDAGRAGLELLLREGNFDTSSVTPHHAAIALDASGDLVAAGIPLL